MMEDFYLRQGPLDSAANSKVCSSFLQCLGADILIN